MESASHAELCKGPREQRGKTLRKADDRHISVRSHTTDGGEKAGENLSKRGKPIDF